MVGIGHFNKALPVRASRFVARTRHAYSQYGIDFQSPGDRALLFIPGQVTPIDEKPVLSYEPF